MMRVGSADGSRRRGDQPRHRCRGIDRRGRPSCAQAASTRRPGGHRRRSPSPARQRGRTTCGRSRQGEGPARLGARNQPR